MLESNIRDSGPTEARPVLVETVVVTGASGMASNQILTVVVGVPSTMLPFVGVKTHDGLYKYVAFVLVVLPNAID